MEGHISEEDLLSGIELLPTTEPGTPASNLLKAVKIEQSLSEDSLSPTKAPSSQQSPIKLPTSYFSTSIQDVQKRLRDSLASSLRKEAEMKNSWHASPGEVKVTHEVQISEDKNQSPSLHQSHLDNSQNPPIKISVNVPSSSSSRQKFSALNAQQHSGPNICLSSKFPSGISPIKSTDHNKMQSSLNESSNSRTNEDPNTEKLLAFIKQLEKGPKSDKSVASHLSQLSILLKKSTNEQTAKPITMTSSNKMSQEKPDAKPSITAAPKPSKVAEIKVSASSNFSKTNRHKKSAVEEKVKPVKISKSKAPSVKSVQFLQQTTKQKSKKSKKTVDNQVDEKPPEVSSRAVNDMVAVRNHLQTMLNLQKVDASALDLSGPDLHISNNNNNTQESKDDDTFRSTDTATLLRAQPGDMVPSFNSSKGETTPDLTDSLTSNLFSILKCNKPSSTRSSVDSSIATENGILRDTLEKEKYRRQHCEKQIQKLQKKMLEIQQELAVAHSTDRKKDLMIEQLDKTLAKVVEGWKSHETNLVKSVENLTVENEKQKEESIKLKEMLVGIENELAKSLEDLVDAKETIVRVQESEQKMKQTYQTRSSEIARVIDQKNEQIVKLEAQEEEAEVKVKKIKEELKRQKSKFESEKKNFIDKEEAWEEIIMEMEKKHKQEMKFEKDKLVEETKRTQDLRKSLASTEEEMRRLEGLLDAQRGEMESMKTSSAVLDAKHSAMLQKLKAENEIHTERQITEKLSQFHQSSQKNENLLREANKKQVLELVESHRRELKAQSERYEEELQKRVAAMKKALDENEKSQNQKLQVKSELIRQQMLGKMQNLLQSHYNETLEVVGGSSITPPSSQHELETSSYHLTPAPSIVSSQSIMTSQAYEPCEQSFKAYHHTNQHEPINQQSNQKTNNQVTQKMDITEEPLTNLSLISDISQSTTTSYPQIPSFSSRIQQYYDSVPQPNHPIPVPQTQPSDQLMQQPQPSVVEPIRHDNSIVMDEVVRQKQLQHYVQMLLQRPPGDPVSTMVDDVSLRHNEDNKENAVEQPAVVRNQPHTSQHMVQHQSHASPDLVPVKQNKLVPMTVAMATTNHVLTSSTTTKRSKPVVRFAPTDVKVNQPVTMATPLPQLTDQSPSIFSPAQMSEISQILGMYSSSATPTGDTKVAAENLLRYLKGNPPFDNKSIFQPSVASSPLKQSLKNSADTSLLNCSVTSGGRKRSTSKSFPAWR
uniref:centrobin-like isoform X2 n=1 Tax=Ciona intestinalis TaxID=7719 RepID=UPI00089DCE58|nr:centrobin-like isoform X2 [Ciona intestinalis]|eukprot:XP_018667952.1 centrobin-like isoform X2 [Ciona intestinalis]